MRRRCVVIYTRFSSDMQRTESCDDQEREVRKALTNRGIDLSSDVIVIRDEAVSGTRSDREGFQTLTRMIKNNEVGVLAVDDQSRLTRGENAVGFVRDLVFRGGRFLATSENIDTAQPGWDLRVKIGEITHGETVRGLSAKVRRGQAGRVLADDSAGDFPYGYESFYHDPDWQQQLARRGPKPKKGLKVNDAEARWVRTVFDWFVGGKSINAIARLLTRERAPKGRRATKPGWHPQQVHRILTNEKYVGLWRWGETTTIRDSQGRTKQVPVPDGEVVVQERPDLRIVEQPVWDRARARLGQQVETFGTKPGQSPRGPKAAVHPTALHPRSTLGGVLTCAACGHPMWHKTAGPRRYYVCSKAGSNQCDQSFQVPAQLAEDAVIGAVTRRAGDRPEWIRDVTTRLQAILRRAAQQLPEEQAHAEQRLAELQGKHTNLLDAVERGGSASSGIATRIVALEKEIDDVETRLKTLRVPRPDDLVLPCEEWVREQITDWSRSLTDPEKMARAIHEAVARIEARSIVAPGKKRGYPELTLHFRAWEFLRAVVGQRMPASLQQILPEALDVPDEATEVIAIGGPTLMDRWAPRIAQWRQEGVLWEEIVRRTGMDLNRVYVAWQRYQNPKKSA